MVDNAIMLRLKDEVRVTGAKDGTPEFDVRLRAAQVRACQELRNLPGCTVCPHVMFCGVIAAHRADAAAVAFLRRLQRAKP